MNINNNNQNSKLKTDGVGHTCSPSIGNAEVERTEFQDSLPISEQFACLKRKLYNKVSYRIIEKDIRCWYLTSRCTHTGACTWTRYTHPHKCTNKQTKIWPELGSMALWLDHVHTNTVWKPGFNSIPTTAKTQNEVHQVGTWWRQTSWSRGTSTWSESSSSLAWVNLEDRVELEDT